MCDMPVTAQYLLEGAALSLEQCGLLLRDANLLYRGGSYASAVVLTAFGQEELGRSMILFDRRRQVLSGKKFTRREIERICRDHKFKQQEGMLSTTLVADRDSPQGKLLQVHMESHPQSAEWKEAEAELMQIIEAKKRDAPGDRHKRRMSALFVEPISGLRWNRPAETSAAFARECLQEAVNDYAGQYSRSRNFEECYTGNDIDPKDQAEFEQWSAFQQWSDRPELPAPEYPPFLSG